MISSWTHLPFSIAHKLAHALSAGRKVNLLGLMPACCIFWKSSIIFSYCPALTYLMSLLVHEELCNCTVPGAILASSASTHAGFCWLSSQSAACVALCLKSGYFAFPFSNLLSHHCEGSEKNSCQSFSLLLLHRTPKRRAFSRTILFRVAMP
jgi:hypothetical protein